jgi:hypothetical protein
MKSTLRLLPALLLRQPIAPASAEIALVAQPDDVLMHDLVICGASWTEAFFWQQSFVPLGQSFRGP